jgi:hypothetical protein
MKVYAQEIADGISEQIQSQASISYASPVEPSESTNHNTKTLKALASIDDSDLYYVQSILVSSSWNKNDDIFDKAEVWAAKNTPEDKPTNLNHDENIIIGHITSNWPITDDGVLIDKDTPVENIPDKFHILTGSVIYKAYQSPELKERTAGLINEIETGQKYVSMECFFKDFDYGVTDKSSGEYKVIARSDDTAYLTKHLRAYGGLGEHENYKIGRVLRQITFSGKGYVDKPANPDSIIFNTNLIEEKQPLQTEAASIIDNIEEKNELLENTGVIANELVNENMETIQMNDTENKLAELETALASKEQELAQIVASVSECEALAAKKDEDMKKKEEEIEKMKAELLSSNEVLAGYKMKEEEMMKKEKKNKRMASLLEAGVESAEAETLLDKLESVDDNAFEAMASALAAKKAKPEMKEEKMAKKEKAEELVTEKVLETVEEEASAVDLAIGGSEESQIDSTRAALIDYVYARLGKLQPNKGE